MSRHQLTAAIPHLELFLGFDPPLRHFFGQLFDPTLPDVADDLIARFPPPKALPDRITTEEQARAQLRELVAWARPHAADEEALGALLGRLLREWAEAEDRIPTPFSLLLENAAETNLEAAEYLEAHKREREK
jgi:hypothetical protein